VSVKPAETLPATSEGSLQIELSGCEIALQAMIADILHLTITLTGETTCLSNS